MTMWTGIVLIVFISVSFSYLTKRARYQMGDARITDRLGKQDLIIRELQERVANLEALVLEEEKRKPFRELCVISVPIYQPIQWMLKIYR